MPASQGDRLCQPLALLGGNPAIRWALCRVGHSSPWGQPSLSTQFQASGVTLTAWGPFKMRLEPAWAHAGQWRLHRLHLQLWPPAKAPWHRCAQPPCGWELPVGCCLAPQGTSNLMGFGPCAACSCLETDALGRWWALDGRRVPRHVLAHTVYGCGLTLSASPDLASKDGPLRHISCAAADGQCGPLPSSHCSLLLLPAVAKASCTCSCPQSLPACFQVQAAALQTRVVPAPNTAAGSLASTGLFKGVVPLQAAVMGLTFFAAVIGEALQLGLPGVRVRP